jgi:hypothetical protein
MADAMAAILAAKKPNRKTTHILLDPELKDQRALLLADLKRAEKYDEKHNERDTAPPILEAIEALDEKIAEQRQAFTFQSIGRKPYGALLDEYKPREGDEDDEEYGFNADEFPPRIIALSSYEPKITLETAREIWDGDDWSDAETTLLLGAAIIANKEIVDVPFTNDGLPMGTRSTATPSNTATTEASPTPSS